jgi:hypothetical protein
MNDEDLDGLIQLIVVAVVVVIVLGLLMLVLAATEGVRIVRRHWGSRRGTWLGIASIALSVCLAAALAISQVAPDAAGWLAACATAAWALTAAVIDASAGPDLLGAGDDVLIPWKPVSRAA